MVPTAISHRNTSAMSTSGRSGEYSCTDTEKKATVHAKVHTKEIKMLDQVLPGKENIPRIKLTRNGKV
jgi:hypothetical protein